MSRGCFTWSAPMPVPHRGNYGLTRKRRISIALTFGFAALVETGGLLYALIR
jgi:hypothetical protein